MVSKGLYSPEIERDACGIGFVANIKSNKSNQIISDALTILENMEHRGACSCENNTCDGSGGGGRGPRGGGGGGGGGRGGRGGAAAGPAGGGAGGGRGTPRRRERRGR